MKRFALVALVAFALGGCATTTPYGNFIQPSVTADQQQLAGDAAKQLVALWPPAKTQFELQQPTPDEFGAALVSNLRAAGYAVLEYALERTSSADNAAPDQTAGEPLAVAPPTTAALALRYVLDHDAGSGLYRLTLLVGSQSITRPYLEQNRTLIPAGYWARKE
ncbi:conjugal transfer protein TrbH [Aromatoleum buckelii]|uniref:Conjugal transfer protein TrbH n=1 Tax=Aromatoleum buckelii TaxID=200254 RepID=A0ABX1N5V0_9RHOO|nr:conjugal transfer protein TrbH [Aromatoleum buckelii]MCK0509590.1 conjugal transfer protein TrbH [Aromatoleum buckelii]